MNKLKILSALGAVLLIVSMAGCTSSAPIKLAPSPSESQGASPSATPVPQVAIAVPSPDEKVLGQLSSQRGTGQIGPFPRTTDNMAVYAVCVGAGEMNVVVPGVASFPLECDPTGKDPGIKNVIDVRYVGTIAVQGQGDGNVLWGLTATAMSGR